LQVVSPQKGHSTGVDGLLRESEPDGFTQVCTSSNSISLLIVPQPLSFEENVENTHQLILDTLALFNSQRAQMNPDWHAKFLDNGARLFKFVKDNIRDETRHTLPKTNERDRCNQPLPENIIGRQFGTFTRRNHAGQ
jgi:hypothetical protein